MEAFRAPLLVKGVQVLFSSKLTCSLVLTGVGGICCVQQAVLQCEEIWLFSRILSGSTVEYLEDVFSFCGGVSYFWW